MFNPLPLTAANSKDQEKKNKFIELFRKLPRLVARREHYRRAKHSGRDRSTVLPHNAKSRAPIEICWLAQIKSSFSTSTVNGLPWSRRSPFTRGEGTSLPDESSFHPANFLCRCLENFSIRNLVNRYPDVSRIVRVFRGFFHRGIIHFIPWTTKDSRERCFWKERERERMRRDSCGKWKMILVIWILGLEQLDFRLEQGEEEGFLEGFWIYVEFN